MLLLVQLDQDTVQGHVPVTGRHGRRPSAPGLPGPALPRPVLRPPRLEDQVPTRRERRPGADEHVGPLPIVEEHLGDVAGHHRQADPDAGQVTGVRLDPPHSVGACLGPGDVERRDRRVDAHHVHARRGGEQGEASGAAADVEQRSSSQLRSERQIGPQVVPLAVEGVVERCEPGSVKIASGTRPR